MRPRAFSGLSRAVLVFAVSSLGAACSSDVARFDDNPFSTRQVASASAPQQVQAAPVAQVDSQPLPARDFVVPSPPPAATAQGGGSPFGQGGDPGLTTGTVTPRQGFGSSSPNTPAVRQMAMGQTTSGGPAGSGRGGWSATGGTTIRAAQGDTPEALSRRYGVPANAIAQANGISGNQPFSAGQNVVIPTYSLAGASAPQPARSGGSDLVRQPVATPDQPRRVQTQAITSTPQRTAAATPTQQPGRMNWQPGAQPSAASPAPASVPTRTATRSGTHTVTGGETLAGVARRYGISRQQLATANRLQPTQSLRTGQILQIPSAQAAATSSRQLSVEPSATPAPAARREQAQRAVAQAQSTPAGRQADPQPTAAIPPAQPALAAQQSTPAPAPVQAAAEASATAEAPARAASAEPQFRWPVRGRVVSSFRAGSNDGIKLSVPQGTPIKAAEDGVVAYAGNELRGYGNLVLVRHANGFVTAYAHNSSIAVRRGEQVRRGQTIAAAGQTGNVSSPQLHFEIRRGATPVDPMTFLGAN
ncbi:peptidoglycan DD-metalloendopeptidase family protein [Phreatobacter sp. HK31-P]